MVRPSELESPTSAMSRRRSNQLSYGRILFCYCHRMRLLRLCLSLTSVHPETRIRVMLCSHLISGEIVNLLINKPYR